MEKEPLLPSSSSNQQQSNLENSILFNYPKRKLHRSKSNPSTITPFNDLENHPPPHPNAPHVVKKPFTMKQVILLLFLYLTIGVVICSFFMDQFKSNKTHPIVDALYFCILTICTIGYSDMTPNSTLTKLFSILCVLVSFGIFHILLTRFVTYVLDSQKNIAQNGLFDMRTRIKVALALGIFVLCIGTGVVFMHFVEKIGWFDSFYFSLMGVTSVGYGERVFESMGGRIFASIWLVVSIIVFVRVFVFLVEIRVDERQRKVEKWLLEQNMTVADLFAADIDNNGFVSKSEYVIYKLKEMGKIAERDILLIGKQFQELDTGNCGRITLSNIIENHY